MDYAQFSGSRADAGSGVPCVRRDFAVLLRRKELLESVVDAGLRSGANRISRLEFRRSDLPRHRGEARVKAALAAREKAESLARALGVRVGRPLEISEEPTEYESRGLENNYVGAAAGQEDEVGSLPAGQIRVRARVRVKFDLGE